MVLAMLGLNVNSVTSMDQLIEAVWGEYPPLTARGQVQVCISEIRKLLTRAGYPRAVRTLNPGYVLELGEADLDSLAFTSRIAAVKKQIDAGHAAGAVAGLQAALALWRGDALVGVQSDLVQRTATALDEKRLVAVEEYMRLRLELGPQEELISELLALAAKHPLRERLHGFLMRALYKSGRQADALKAYQRVRATLVEQMGIEPGQELQDLHRAILVQDASLHAPRTTGARHGNTQAGDTEFASARSGGTSGSAQSGGTSASTPPDAGGGPDDHAQGARSRRGMLAWTPPRQLPASIADFTGRSAEIAEIRRLLVTGRNVEFAGYAMPIVAISGRGGVGKSTLAIRAAHEIHDSFEDGVLYAELRGLTSSEQISTQLARFLRALGVPGPAIPDGAGERMELYRSCLSAKHVLVVLDDVLDEDQIRPLLPGSPTCAVITTSRNKLTGLPGAHHVAVEALDAAESFDMLTKILGSERVLAEEPAARELYRLCDGLPLALRISGARLVSRKRWPIGRLVDRMRDEVRRLDELEHRGWELRSSIGLTYRSLDGSAKRLFRLLSMLQAPDVPSWAAAALLDTDVASAEDVLERLIDAHVLQSVDHPNARHLRYRFHDLIQVYARERLAETETPGERAAALSRALGAWLGLAEVAHRKEYGGDYTLIHGAAPRWRPPDADLAAMVGDPAEWWDGERSALVAAVHQAAEAGLDELCWDLALTCVTLFEARAYLDDWWEVAHTAREAALRAGNPTGVAAMAYSIGTLHMFQGRLAEAEESFLTAVKLFEAGGDEHGLALVLRNAANVDGLRGNDDEMIAKYDRALKLLREVGDHVGAAHVMRTQAKHWLRLGHTDRAHALLEQALETCREVGCVRVEAQVLHSFAELHLMTGELDLARQELYQVLRVVRDGGDRIGEAHALYSLGLVRYREGRLDNAETTMAHTLELARSTGERMIEAKAGYTLGEIALARGNNASGVRHIEKARSAFQELGSAVWTAKAYVLLADSHAANGDLALARRELDEAVALLTADGSAEARRMLGTWPERGPYFEVGTSR
ncbi:AfsR/SARP family transcriptional regulator [Sphaerimonospora sp. CA-214678]|uniref:AfsR/SARP family transcriptional regulator n=1 Tax=Sphaerimonospora sp. CA-214678 TaxID=3240029 RepID=UPI003D933AB3